MTARDDYPFLAAWSQHVDAGEVAKALDHIAALRAALFALVDHEDEPCHFDHHGYCQEHPGGFGDNGCGTAIGRALLGLEHTPPKAPQ